MTAVRITEAAFQAQVIDLARIYRWRVAHFRAAQTTRGWRTPVAADGAGFPDLLMVRGDRVVAAELKATGGRVSHEQRGWLDAFAATPVETHVWRPGDWLAIEAVLTRPETP